jgi:hypothetical protein
VDALTDRIEGDADDAVRFADVHEGHLDLAQGPPVCDQRYGVSALDVEVGMAEDHVGRLAWESEPAQQVPAAVRPAAVVARVAVIDAELLATLVDEDQRGRFHHGVGAREERSGMKAAVEQCVTLLPIDPRGGEGSMAFSEPWYLIGSNCRDADRRAAHGVSPPGG